VCFPPLVIIIVIEWPISVVFLALGFSVITVGSETTAPGDETGD